MSDPYQQLEYGQFQPPMRKKNRRTLKRRVRRLFYLSNLINLILFGCITIALIGFIFKPITEAVSNYISSTIADEINSKPFLEEMNIAQLEDFDPTSSESQGWKASMDRMAKIDYFIPFMDRGGVVEGKQGGKSIVVKDGDSELGNLGLTLTAEEADGDMIYVNVELQGKIVYTNTESSEAATNVYAFVDDLYNYQSIKPLYNTEGNVIGEVTVGFSPAIKTIMISVIFVLFIVMFLLMLFITLILSKLFAIPVIKPLLQLNKNIKDIAQDHYEDVAGSRLELKKPLREIEALADSTNLIMQKMNAFADQLTSQKQKLEDQNEELEAQNLELMESKEIIQAAQLEITQKEAALSNILNHAGQGFLTFNTSLSVNPVHSMECVRLLSPDDGLLAGHSFPELISQGDDEQRIFMDNILVKILQDPDHKKRDIYMPLLTDEVEIRGRIVNIAYKIIPDPEKDSGELFLVVLTDITEKRALQSQMEAERNTLKMVVKVMVHYSDFSVSVKDFRRFMDFDLKLLYAKEETLKDKISVVFRQLHTYKGTFAQWGLIHITERLHEAESQLSKLSKQGESGASDWLMRVNALDLIGALEADLRILRGTVGDDFLKDRDVLMIDKSRLLEIEKKMIGALSPFDCKLLLPDLRKLRYKPFKDLLKTYPDYVEGLASRMEKYLHRFEVRGGDFLADTDKYGELGRSLVHLFRNAVDHGIETIEERAAAGKEDYANMICDVSLEHDQIVVVIADDGQGIPVEALRARALAAGLFKAETLEQMSDSEVLRLIFRDELSTKEQVTELSGRGIGLSSVLAEVERLGGHIEVASESGKGTLFRIVIPGEDLSDMPQLGIPTVIEPLIRTTETFFQEQIGFLMEPAEIILLQQGKNDKLMLNKVTTFINVKGAVEGIFVMTAEDKLSRSLLQRMVIGGIPEEEEDSYVEDCIAEAANIILGNSLKQLQSLEEFIVMDPPITIRTEGASIRYADSEIWTCTLDSEQGQLRVGFVTLKRSSQTFGGNN